MNVAKNIKAIRSEKGIKQEVIAEALGFDTSNYSRIENGTQQLKVNQLEIIANTLNVHVTYLLTYPKVFIEKPSNEEIPEKVSITFEVSPEKREHLLRIVAGDNFEIIKNG